LSLCDAECVLIDSVSLNYRNRRFRHCVQIVISWILW